MLKWDNAMAMAILRLLLTTATVVVLTVFVIQNMTTVPINLILRGPVNVNLIFLLLAAFILGGLSVIFFMMVTKVQRKLREKKIESSVNSHKVLTRWGRPGKKTDSYGNLKT